VRARNSRSWLTITAGSAAEHERLQAVEAVEVEVVGGLVEEQHVEAGEQQRREADPRGLAARQPVIGMSSPTPSPRSAATSPARSSRSAPPRESQRSSATA
jgi:hypothetical protein